MNKKTLYFSLFLLMGLLFTACQSANQEQKTAPEAESTASTTHGKVHPKKGAHVPSHLVCMVNDEYMGKEQIQVPHDGKMYYGCCNMCKERIPKDESVRYAIDPQTMAKVDKAKAYIVLIGDKGEVAYFENEENYQKFIQ